MSIDPSNETLISLSNAAKRLPARRAGKRPHVSCIYRWTVSGCRGQILESIQIGGTRCTSIEALDRFFARLTEAAGRSPQLPRFRSPAQRQRDSEAAERELDRLGI